jgi:hypothetical protein
MDRMEGMQSSFIRRYNQFFKNGILGRFHSKSEKKINFYALFFHFESFRYMKNLCMFPFNVTCQATLITLSAFFLLLSKSTALLTMASTYCFRVQAESDTFSIEKISFQWVIHSVIDGVERWKTFNV